MDKRKRREGPGRAAASERRRLDRRAVERAHACPTWLSRSGRWGSVSTPSAWQVDALLVNRQLWVGNLEEPEPKFQRYIARTQSLLC